MTERLRAASKAALIHLLLVLGVAGIVAVLVFVVWFPYPYYKISGGITLFFLFLCVSVFCGPLLTLTLFDPSKDRWKWCIDLLLIFLLQILGFVYGIYQITQSRPVFLAFEGDRFRVVRAADVLSSEFGSDVDHDFSRLSWKGPVLIGVKLLQPTDPEYLTSLTLAVQGLHPSFRPSRWLSYSSQQEKIVAALKPLSSLPNNAILEKISSKIENAPLFASRDFGYLPVVQENITDWIVVVRHKDGMPIAYWHIDGW